MGKDILHRVGNGGHCGCETVSREVLPQVEIPEKWTQEPPCFAITIWCAIKIAHMFMCMGLQQLSKWYSTEVGKSSVDPLVSLLLVVSSYRHNALRYVKCFTEHLLEKLHDSLSLSRVWRNCALEKREPLLVAQIWTTGEVTDLRGRWDLRSGAPHTNLTCRLFHSPLSQP